MAEDINEILQRFGFTQYESKAYQALVRSGSSNASSISKTSGIPRARIYDTLESLVEQGIVMTEENAEGLKTYTCLPVSVFLEKIRNGWLTDFSIAEKELKVIENQGEKQDTYISTLRGKDNILAYCRILIRRAKKQLILSLWDTMYNELLPDLQEAVQNGCRVRGITFEVSQPLEGLSSHRLNAYMASLRSENWFILSIDRNELLYGHSAERDSKAFYTDDAVHIYLLEDYVWHDVLVNRLIKKQGSPLDNWIIPEMEEFFNR